YKLSLYNYLEHQNNLNIYTQNTKNIFNSFESFEKALKEIFSNFNEEYITAQQLINLKQIKLASAYTVRFKQLLARLL
ncbi:hypothetical protein M406DRAFT_249409, partial [Cryphonectria parasitica EP155]